MVCRSGPNILMPIGLRIPVESMSILFLIGMVQILGMPMKFNFSFISSISFSWLIVSGQILSKGPFMKFGKNEYHLFSFRHSEAGFNAIVVSIILNGAVSVEVSARPALPKTVSTSGNDFRI